MNVLKNLNDGCMQQPYFLEVEPYGNGYLRLNVYAKVEVKDKSGNMHTFLESHIIDGVTSYENMIEVLNAIWYCVGFMPKQQQTYFKNIKKVTE